MTPAWQDLLQEYFDCDRPGAPPSPESPADRDALRRLIAGLDRLAPPAPPADLASRIAASLTQEARRRRRWRYAPAAGLVAAASLLLVLGTRLAWPPREVPPATTTVIRAEPFRDSLGRAGTALSSLTTRSAESTVENTSSLLPLVNAPTLPLMPTLEPPLEPFVEATAGVSTGLAPVTDSAQRAVRLFLRDLPFRPTLQKPG
jgi:hypothetical protein